VGEAPGEAEERERKPFQGPAGHVLNAVLASIGLTRSDVFVTNVVKYRPVIGQLRVRNRTPNLAEQMASWPYVWREVDVFSGVPIVCLGKVALAALGPPGVKISDWHGVSWTDPAHTFTAWYHPAVAVYEPDMMPTLVDDARMFLDTVLRAP
jgi:DNA polymerase